MIIDASKDEIDKVANYIIEATNKKGIVILRGDLASGKTTLASKIATKISNSQGASSPTFSLQHIYSDKLFHYDLYRVSFDEIISLGLIEEFDKDGLHLIEWADDRLIELLLNAGYDIWLVEIMPITEGRRYEIQKLIS